MNMVWCERGFAGSLGILLAMAPLVTQAESALTADEIRIAFVGKILSDGAHWSSWLLPEGQLKSIQMGRTLKGRWQIRGRMLCLKAPNDAPFECWTVFHGKDGYLLGTDGTPVFAVSAEEPSNKYQFR